MNAFLLRLTLVYCYRCELITLKVIRKDEDQPVTDDPVLLERASWAAKDCERSLSSKSTSFFSCDESEATVGEWRDVEEELEGTVWGKRMRTLGKMMRKY